MVYTIRQVLKENWQNYLKTHEVKDYQKREAEKTINCSKRSCNSRICSSCGKRYADKWSDNLKDYLLPIEHNHIVLTIPSCLRRLLKDWNHMKSFMDASNSFLKNNPNSKLV